MAIDSAARLRRARGTTRESCRIRHRRIVPRASAARFLNPRFLSLLLLLPTALAAWHPARADTFYVRTDGGDAIECSGRSDAPYPGSGTAQACAWKHPFYALAPGGVIRIAGGDTLFIGNGSYMIGQGAPGAGSCVAGNCFMPPVPSGTAAARTRILGVGASAPRLWGTAGVVRMLNLDGSSNVEIGNLEITDQDDCVYNHSDAASKCAAAGSGSWAKYGLYARASSNVWLHDLNIHGMGHTGINAGGLTDWTLERVRIFANGRAGWDFNIGTGSSNAGSLTLRGIEIGWNGCGERWQTGEPWACWAQKAGGYGDGLGTVDTGGNWLIEDAYVHHNTSDGLDLRFLNGADATRATLRRIHALANAGNQVKVRGNALIENSVLIGQCGYFKNRYFMFDGDHCRSDGTTLQLVFTGNDVVVVRHNTIAGEGYSQIGISEGNTTDRGTIQNNVVVGYPYFLSPNVLTFLVGGTSPAVITYSGNLAWNVRNNACPTGTICGQDPKLAGMALAAFDAEPLAGSPVSDKVAPLADVASDFVLQPRPYGVNSDIGAYELQFDNPCIHATPTLGLVGPTAAVAAGTTVGYTVELRNNDNSVCSATSFSLASSVPGGWTGSLGASSFTLVPGASASTTLSVTSAADAAPASYDIGVGSGSSEGAIHTSSASASYVVSTPTPTCTRATPTVNLTGPTPPVPAGTSVEYTLNVDNNDSAGCAVTSFSLADSVPAGWSGTLADASLSLAAGTSGSTSLDVTSATDASAGDYSIGAGVGSSVGAVHTANASATYAVAAPVPTCTHATPTLRLDGPTTAAPAGTAVDYTISLDNNDSAACAATSFSLASSAPAGWSGVLGTSTLSLAPGASGGTTLRVTSASNASAASYDIGIGASSNEGAIHTSSASATYTVSTPPPTCTRAAPTISLTGPTTAVPAGTAVDYTVSLDNNDSAACAATSFSLARSVPVGWTGNLTAASLSLAPGTTGNTTLRVTSAANAAAAVYSIGAGASSAVGAVHTANASSTYTLATAAPALQTQVGTNKATYARGETVQINALLRNNGVPVSGVVVSFSVTRPNTTATVSTATSGSDGYARTTYKVSKAKTAPGQYTVRASWSLGGTSASGVATFNVL